MNLNDYFDPVSLEKPDDSFRFSDSMFGRNIRVHTPNEPIDEISNYQVALLGVPEDRGSWNNGSGLAPDLIRSKLYELTRVNEKLRIIDLGNLKGTAQVADSYFGIRDVMLDLLNNQVTAVVLGGTQDITHGIFMAYELARESINMVNVDSRIDGANFAVHASSWFRHLLKSRKLFACTMMGTQQYLVNAKEQEMCEDRSCEVIRLGNLRSSLPAMEPHMRDAHLVSMDIAAVKQADAPGSRYPSPNGLFADEFCQLARYAGLSDHVSCLGLFEANPKFDNHDMTTHLAAQAAWYFMEGFSQRKRELPSQENPDFRVFMVNHEDMEHELTFFKSLVTGRWWMEIPVVKTGTRMLVACSDVEYQQACRHEIPELWWRAFQKAN